MIVLGSSPHQYFCCKLFDLIKFKQEKRFKLTLFTYPLMTAQRTLLTLSGLIAAQIRQSLEAKHVQEERSAQRRHYQKNRAQRINTALQWLLKRYPACFNLAQPRPLKLRIDEDILKDIQDLINHELNVKPSKNSLQDALKSYTKRRRYLKSCFKYTHRIDLEGQELSDQIITSAQQAHVTRQLRALSSKCSASTLQDNKHSDF